MKQYQEALFSVVTIGVMKENRTGIDCLTRFGVNMEFDLAEGFPAVTTKKLAWKSVVAELLWMLEGSTDERRLAEILHGTRDPSKTTIWTANADAQGAKLGYPNTDTTKELGPIYGHQWRRGFDGLDQIALLITALRHNPNSRRHILTAWNPTDLSDMALPPCHLLANFVVIKNKLNCSMYQRSADMFLGVPFNIASYALLTHILAMLAGMDVGRLIINIGDAHIYKNHIPLVHKLLLREPRPLPKLRFPTVSTLNNLLTMKPDNFVLENYDPHPAIPAPMAV